jgi:MFS family permease
VGAIERYRRVLRAPHVGRLWVVMTIARLPMGINSLAIVLAMREETGSFAAAGAAAGANALALGLSNPVQGRLLDRLGPRRAVPPLVAFHITMFALFVALLPSAPTGVLIALAGLAGLGQPPWGAILRAMWPRLLGSESMVTTAFALDSAFVELVFVAGPLLVAAAVAVAAPQAALVVSMALVLAGTLLLVSSPAVVAWEPEVHEARGPFGALASPGLLTVVLATVPLGMAFGAFEISLPAFAEAHGDRGDAGLLIAIWALGSAAGGLAYGAREWSSSLAQRWLVLTGALGFAMLAPVVSPSVAVMALLLLPAGAFIAPAIASGSQLLGAVAPRGMTTEAYAWGPTALVGGVAAGSAVAGGLVEAYSWRAAILLAAAAAALGACVAVARRATLRPAWPATPSARNAG